MNFIAKLASQSGVIFAGRIFGAGLTFIVQALIARWWGAEQLADYMLAIATVNLIAAVMPLGFQTVGTYFAAEYSAKRERSKLVAFLLRAYGHVAALMVILLAVGAPLIGRSGLGHVFWPIAVLSLATAIVYVNGAVLVGLKRPYAGYFAESVFRPMMVLSLFFICLVWASTAEQGLVWLMQSIAVGFLIIALVHFAYALSAVRGVEQDRTREKADPRRWWRFALPWVIIGFATDFFFDIDLLLLSSQLSKADLAVFGVATKVFSLIAFAVSAIYAVTLPEMFEREAADDRRGFLRKVGEANLAASLASLLMLGGIIVLGPFALSFFGPSFVAGAWPLALLSLALLVRSLFGPAAMVLSIYDRPWASVTAVAVGLLALVAGNYLLVPSFGLMGAAIAATFAISLWSCVLWLIAWRLAKVDVSIRQFFVR